MIIVNVDKSCHSLDLHHMHDSHNQKHQSLHFHALLPKVTLDHLDGTQHQLGGKGGVMF